MSAAAVVIGAGQSGLAAAHALRHAGLVPVVLEAGDEPVGSWPSYYDSLTLFSPARYSALPGMAFPGDPDGYPHRDEVVEYLRRYAKNLDADIRTGHRVTRLRRDGEHFAIEVADGTTVTARLVIAATGGFGEPYRAALPGLDTFAGTVLHSADYREPGPFAGQRVVVVGAANTAVQVGYELAKAATVTLATRRPVRFAPQRPLGRDVHFWSRATGFDHLPIGHLLKSPPHTPVNDDGRYRRAVEAGKPDQRRMFTAIEHDVVTWPDGTVSGSTRSCSPPVTVPHCPTWTSRSGVTRGGSPLSILDWVMWVWNGSAASPPRPSAVSAAMPATSSAA